MPWNYTDKYSIHVCTKFSKDTKINSLLLCYIFAKVYFYKNYLNLLKIHDSITVNKTLLHCIRHKSTVQLNLNLIIHMCSTNKT